MEILNYTQIAKEYVSEIDATVYLLEHEKTKAKIMYMQNDDPHKTFGIGFRTPIEDSTGVPHIMEHSVLCGSRKFDLKDPFVELAKGSLNTYLNAMTYPDKTLYPISSQNDKDFHNLMDVYLDAVFFPSIYKNPYRLMQEGWRYELEDLDAPLVYKGVVYNEMKGAFSSPEEVIFRKIKESLFPDNLYNYESGGAPENIVELTFEAYKDYHKTFYHPSNCYIALYGKMDINEVLTFIDKEYLSNFDYQHVDSAIPLQKPFDEVVSNAYPYSVTEEKGNQLYLSYNVVIGETTNKMFVLGAGILEYILLDTPASPLRKALLKEGIGDDVFGILQTHVRQPMFSVVAKNVASDKEERFYEIIHEVLTELCNNGIDKDLIEGAIQVREFSLREGESRGYSKGLSYFITSMKSWIYDKNPIEQLKYEHELAQIKKLANEGYFENLIRDYILNNTHASKIKLYPVKGLDIQQENEITQKLAAVKASLSQEQLQQYIDETKAFKEFQTLEDDPQQIESIPLLTKDELTIEPLYPKYELIARDGKDYIVTEVFTNKICYLSWYVHLEGVDKQIIPYLGALVGILGKLDTKASTYEQLSAKIDKYLGGMEYHLQGIANTKEEGKNERYFLIKNKALTQYLDKQLSIFSEILRDTKFDDYDRVLEILKELRAMMQVALSGDGHKVAISRLLSHFTPLQEFEELGKGITFYHMVEMVVDNWEQEKENFVLNLKEAYKILGNRSRIQVGVIVDEDNVERVLDSVNANLAEFESGEFDNSTIEFTETAVKEAIVYAGNVNYVAMGYNFKDLGYDYTGSMQMLKSILSMDYLWTEVRVKNGAYGCFSDFRRSGNVFFVSYRDPNIIETLDTYRRIGDYIRNIDLNDRQLLQYLIGTVSTLDFPFTPYTEGATAQIYYFTGTTKEDLQKSRRELFATDNNTLRNFAPLLQGIVDKNQYCVFGNTTSVDESKDIFKTIINV
ncbi:MAG: peptidase M16 [Epulopiscium sp. Nuni2H_MBin001]|nr:MAG: peptidase M16 [Epulopiscium sp. Nuni2H_MBin001]